MAFPQPVPSSPVPTTAAVPMLASPPTLSAAICAVNPDLREGQFTFEGLQYQEYPAAQLEDLEAPYFAVFQSTLCGQPIIYLYRNKYPSVAYYGTKPPVSLPPETPVVHADGPLAKLLQHGRDCECLQQLCQDYKYNMLQRGFSLIREAPHIDSTYNCSQSYKYQLAEQQDLYYIVHMDWSTSGLHVFVRRKVCQPRPSDRKVRGLYRSPPVDGTLERLPADLLEIIEDDLKHYEIPPALKAYRFSTDTHAPSRPSRAHYASYTLRNCTQLARVSYCGPVVLRGDRIYRDVEQPDADCWYLLDCYTHSGHTVPLIVNADIDRFQPVRFTSSSKRAAIDRGEAPLGSVISPEQLGRDVDLEQLGLLDLNLIIAVIKGGLTQ